MGIENFHCWLKEKYPNCFLQANAKNVYDYIYIDANHILHNSIYKSQSEEHFINRIYNNLDLIFCNFIARKAVVLVVDGPAPYAKIVLQRKRRLQLVTGNSINVNTINSLHLTPGTELMIKMKDYLTNYMENINKQSFHKVKYYISSTTEPDEGEIKVIKKIIEYSSVDNNSSHLVISNDADLVVLTVGIKPIYNIHILIKNKSIYELISVPKLLYQFYLYNFKYSKLIYNVNSDSFRDDFTLISIMAGNDYLPKLAFTKMHTLWEAYNIINKWECCHLLTNNTFNKKNFKKFMFSIMNLINSRYSKFNFQTYNKDIIISYLEGLLWCLHMYQTGKCSMYDYHYIGKSAPSPQDIMYFLEFHDDIDILVPESKTQAVPVNIYTVLIIPHQAKELIPKKYYNYMEKELEDVYATELCKICDKFKKDLSTYHKLLKTSEEENNLDNIDIIKKKISKISTSLSKHKKSHIVSFSINDIKKIINKNIIVS